MKKLTPVDFNDEDALTLLISRKTLAARAALSTHKNSISTAYTAYQANRGNILNTPKAVGIPDTDREILKKLYTADRLNIFEDIRRKLSPRVCPMCGSPGSGTLDHVFPKSPYPEFSVFTKNLVPACQCNLRRGVNAAGPNNGRVLHPYFDEIMNERLAIVEFSSTPPRPTSIKACYTGAHLEAVKFHIKEIILKNNAVIWFEDLWASFKRAPSSFITLSTIFNEIGQLESILEDRTHKYDDEYGTKNNWNSMFFAGMAADENVKIYLIEYLNGIINGTIQPETQ